MRWKALISAHWLPMGVVIVLSPLVAHGGEGQAGVLPDCGEAELALPMGVVVVVSPIVAD